MVIEHGNTARPVITSDVQRMKVATVQGGGT